VRGGKVESNGVKGLNVFMNCRHFVVLTAQGNRKGNGNG